MPRAKWKGPYVDTTLIKQNFNNHFDNKTKSRSSEILPSFVGKTFDVHNGIGYTKILITDTMIGHKFGEFAFSRKKFSFKKK